MTFSRLLFPLIVFIVAICFVAYGLLKSLPSRAEVDSGVQNTLSAGEQEEINASIFTSKELTRLESEFKVFGQRPVGADSSQLSRDNPFEGI